MDRSNSINTAFIGTTSPVKIVPSDPGRSCLSLHAVTGACEICIGDNDFNSNAITLQEGVNWEPEQVLTGNIWFRGSGSTLSIITNIAVYVPEGDPPSGDWIVDQHGNYIMSAEGDFLYG